MKIALLCTFLAAIAIAIATVANTRDYDLSTRLDTGPWHILLAVLMGTGVGRVVGSSASKRKTSATTPSSCSTSRRAP
jgi:uncharacterized oligopeptide transporter (OPT) family protein